MCKDIEIQNRYREISKAIYWKHNKQLLNGIVEYKELTIRAGYQVTLEDEKAMPSFQQVHFTFMVNDVFIRNVNELASVLTVHIVSELDEFDYFTKEK